MLTTVTRRYHFESAHWLPFVPEGHKCRRVHGHNYELEVSIEGVVGQNGFILDFFDMDKQVAPLVARLDHRTLNDIAGLENPTAELIAAWFARELAEGDGRTQRVSHVRVYETKDCWADVIPAGQ